MKYIRGYRWWRGDIVLLVGYTRGWLFDYGKKPYNLFVLVLFIIGFVLATLSWLLSPIYRKPPVMGSWFVRPTHRLMRGKLPWRMTK